ncbi:type III-A CRISPR-associated protein Cas10/Csm1 [Pyrococcus horikoshii]|nr:type III-A CRISPR-associated protein Cas10/Csm1 [Pyrococcus horikoshii]HII61493.1 type III-A CRISPR-associated protein Cas10/Csm1 [Pyrococcus horikoshii]
MNAKDLISLGGLFHDIGKPVQRASLYKGDHSEQGFNFLLELAEEFKKKGREDTARIYEKLALFSKYHHKDRMREIDDLGLDEELKVALYLVYVADNISSKEREEPGKTGYDVTRPLKSVFNRELAYPLVELSESRLPFPGHIEKVTKDDYRYIVNIIRKKLLETPLKIDRILPLFEKYLTFVSSATTENNVISLYDHLKMTSAIALALYNAGCRPKKLREADNCMKEENLLLIEGDFSGIQAYIYNVSGKGTLKYLRARSSYLELISWDVVLRIIEELDLTLANVVFNAGGHFMIIAQNTGEARNKLENIRKELSEWLWNNLDGEVYLGLEWMKVKGEDMVKDFREVREKLGKLVARRKLRRFEFVDNIFSFERYSERLIECSVCGREIREEEGIELEGIGKVCKTCEALFHLGGNLLKVKGFALFEKGYEGELSGPFSKFVPITGIIPKGAKYYLLKNTFEPSAEVEGTFVPYFVSDYYQEGEGNQVVTFEELAEASKGAKLVGVIKGDVDHLGLFFSNRETISEYATASRFMDYFFKFYLKQIIRGYYEDVIGYVPSLGEWRERPNVVVVYAGGDDFFIVGAWNEIFELAFRVRNAFSSYTGNNLTISMALGYFHPKTPIYRVAEVMKERLDIAKDEGRNAVYIVDRLGTFRKSYPWDLYIKYWKDIGEKIYSNGLREEFRDKKGLLYKMLEIRDLYAKDPEDVKWAYLLAYHLSRHELEEKFRTLFGIDVEALERGEPQPIYWIDGVLKVILTAVRGG